MRAHLQAGTLCSVLDAFEITPEPVHVVYLAGRRGASKVRSFVEACVTSLRQDLGFDQRTEQVASSQR